MTLTKSNKRKLTEETLAKLKSQCALFSESEALVFPETPKFPELLFLRKNLSTPEIPSAQPPTPKRTVKYRRDECTHSLILFQNLKEMEEIKRFTKSTERKFQELKIALQNISEKNNVNYNNIENSPLLLEILKNCISN